jgi:hypothetical protein
MVGPFLRWYRISLAGFPMADKASPVTVDDIVAAAASGVLRALEVRSAGSHPAVATPPELVRAGFNVQIHIYAGGIPAAALQQLAANEAKG